MSIRDRVHQALFKMKAIVFESYGGPEVLKIQEVKKPEPSNNDVSKNVYLDYLLYFAINSLALLFFTVSSLYTSNVNHTSRFLLKFMQLV